MKVISTFNYSKRLTMITLSLAITLIGSPVIAQTKSQQAKLDKALLEATGTYDKNRNGERSQVMTKLLKQGANPNAKDESGETPLMSAASWAYVKLARLLLLHGAGVNAQSRDGNTALIFAASRGSLEIVTALLKHGAKVGVRNHEGKTALTYAHESHYTKIEQLLMNAQERRIRSSRPKN